MTFYELDWYAASTVICKTTQTEKTSSDLDIKSGENGLKETPGKH